MARQYIAPARLVSGGDCERDVEGLDVWNVFCGMDEYCPCRLALWEKEDVARQATLGRGRSVMIDIKNGI